MWKKKISNFRFFKSGLLWVLRSRVRAFSRIWPFTALNFAFRDLIFRCKMCFGHENTLADYGVWKFHFDAVTLDCTLKKGYKMAGKRQFWVKMGAHGVSFCMWTLIFGHITCLGTQKCTCQVWCVRFHFWCRYTRLHVEKGYKMAGKWQFWVKMGAHGVSFCMCTLIFGHIRCLGHKNALAK